MTETYDVIVIGVGGFGSGAFYHLAKRGLRVLGIEQFGIAHDRGSSHGQTRIIRKAYFEHPNYVPLAIKAYELWRELEAESAEDLMRLSGVVLAGPPGGQAVNGAIVSARQHGLRLELLNPKEANVRFPGLHFAEEFGVVHEPDAGYVYVEKCVRAHIAEGQNFGGVLKANETVLEWSSNGKNVQVRTDLGEYAAAGLVITAGPWSRNLLNELSVPLTVLRKPVFWASVRETFQELIPNWPGFLFELPQGVFYGLPGLERTTLKLAEHTGGQIINDPKSATREILPQDQSGIEEFIRQCVPAAIPSFQNQSVCFYTMAPDSHFLIDCHPGHTNVVFGAGFSGHGFKFTGVLGLVLSEMVTDGKTAFPVDFLSISRFSPMKKT